MIEINSRDNPKIKRIRKIRDRREAGFVFLEGLRLAREAMRSRCGITTALFARSFSETAEFEAVPDQIVVPDSLFESVADTKSSQGIILIAERPDCSRSTFESNLADGHTVCLHKSNNPSNLGAILRTCEASGIRNIIVTRSSADAFSPKAIRASMGSVMRLNLWTDADFSEAVGFARARGLKTTAADVSGKTSYRDADWTVARMVVFGSEADGLATDEIAAIDETIVIPMKNGVESLNLAVSAGIILFHASA